MLGLLILHVLDVLLKSVGLQNNQLKLEINIICRLTERYTFCLRILIKKLIDVFFR